MNRTLLLIEPFHDVPFRLRFACLVINKYLRKNKPAAQQPAIISRSPGQLFA